MPHIHKKIDFCSEVFIVYKNSVLLRKHDKLKMWLSVGGHIELNEDPNEAAIREVKEEVGLNIALHHETEKVPSFHKNNKSLVPPEFVNRQNITNTHEHIGFIFFAKTNTNNLQLSETEITEECRWFTKEEIENDTKIDEYVRFYALKALEKLSE
jgi:8-oxo-dGTP pyrophosphatase MutT (NUDIX family)